MNTNARLLLLAGAIGAGATMLILPDAQAQNLFVSSWDGRGKSGKNAK